MPRRASRCGCAVGGGRDALVDCRETVGDRTFVAYNRLIVAMRDEGANQPSRGILVGFHARHHNDLWGTPEACTNRTP